MLSVCTKGLRVTQFQFSVCMYGTCGRIDKADFDFLTIHLKEMSSNFTVYIFIYKYYLFFMNVFYNNTKNNVYHFTVSF